MTKIEKRIEGGETPHELQKMLGDLFLDVNRGNLQTEKYNIIIGQIAQRVSEGKATPQEIAFLNKIYTKDPHKEGENLKTEIDELFDSIKIA